VDFLKGLVKFEKSIENSIFYRWLFQCPKGFTQILTRACYYDTLKATIPLIHCLINSRTSECYSSNILLEIESIIRKALRDQEHKLNPEIFTCDFEQSLLRSIKDVFPNCTIHGCLVHFLRCNIGNLKKFASDLNRETI
jgi:hypothetical protein